MTRALLRRGPVKAPAKKTRAPKRPSRDDEYRARHRRLHLERIEQAATPADHVREAGDYLADTLRFVGDHDVAWRAAEQASKAIVRIADGLNAHVRRGGRQ